MRRGFLFLRLMCAFLSLSAAVPMLHGNSVQAFTARDLMYGSQGDDVTELQGRLRLLGYYWGKQDGNFSWKTYWAVRTFQHNFGLHVTGEVNMATKIKLAKATPNWKPSSHSQSSPTQKSGRGAPTGSGKTTAPSAAPSATAASFPASANGLGQRDLNLMAHVVYGEARGESFEGEVAIAAVILNRLHSSLFPKTVPSIVYSPGAFSAVDDGQVNLSPDSRAKSAVMKAVQGWDPTHGAIFYFNPAKTSNAFVWGRPEIITIGNHIFTS